MREKTLSFIMLFTILIGVFSVLLPKHAGAAAIFAPKWEKAFGGTGDEEAWCVVNASGGGYLLGGWTTSSGAGDKDFWIVKVSESGIMEWNETYGGTAQDYLCSIVPADDGGYLLGGSTFSFGAGTKDIWLIKIDSTGNALWNKTYGWYEYEDISVPDL